VKSRRFRRPSSWTSSNIVWTVVALDNSLVLAYVTRKGFCDILREIVLVAWKIYLRRTPSASGLSARAVAVVCWTVPLKKDCFALFLLPSEQFGWWKRSTLCVVVEIRVRRRSESAPEYFGISNVKPRVFDRRVMETDWP